MSNKVKLVWKVDSPPVGRYRSFEKRGWPSAALKSGEPMAALYCKDEYVPADVKEGKHGPISIHVADRRSETIEKLGTWRWVKLKRQADTLTEAKELAADFFEQYPEFMPSSPEAKNEAENDAEETSGFKP